MENRVYLQPAYVLHKQAFRNTSLLIDFFCVDYGRVRAIARGARRAKSKYRPSLQVFQPLLVSLAGKGELKTVTAVESSVAAIGLIGERLFSGLYLNELITRLTANNIEYAQLYKNYQNTLIDLQGGDDLNVVLRRFELSLLSELGYGINLEEDCVSKNPFQQDGVYCFIPDLGFEQVSTDHSGSDEINLFQGRHILELQKLQFTDKEGRIAARQILRLALRAHLGGKPLHSRSLFVSRS